VHWNAIPLVSRPAIYFLLDENSRQVTCFFDTFLQQSLYTQQRAGYIISFVLCVVSTREYKLNAYEDGLFVPAIIFVSKILCRFFEDKYLRFILKFLHHINFDLYWQCDLY